MIRRLSQTRFLAALFGAFGVLAAQTALAASTEVQVTPAVEAQLITAENGISPGAGAISAGLSLVLNDGWKTYWRSPGEVGLPPEVDVSGSENVAGVEILWPAPDRFTAFGIQNFGYAEEVVLPLRITLEEPGAPVALRAEANLLICSEICVPSDFTFALDLPAAGAGGVDPIDRAAADRIAEYTARVPVEGPSAVLGEVGAFVNAEGTALTIAARAERPFQSPDVFPEMGEDTAFGVPDIRLGEGGRLLWAELPILTLQPDAPAPVITVTDGEVAATLAATALEAAPEPPFALQIARTGAGTLLWIAAVAFLGGLILNIMPCVLPVLSIKLASVVSGHGRTHAEIRGGFLASAAGVMAFMWALAAITWGLQRIGVTVGWGLQFQSPVFLALMVVILAVFAANMFGLFEINLPIGVQTQLARSGAADGRAGDFATGAFAAVLATPCSAPFLGTAVAFALSGQGLDIAVVFTALGLGLALPYLAVAAAPRVVSLVPRPGRWMLAVKVLLGLLLLLTAAWLIWVLFGVAGAAAAYAAVGLTATLIVLLTLRLRVPVLRWSAIAIFAAAPLVAAERLAERTPLDTPAVATEWTEFDRPEIARLVSRGEVVFVDVTADWCITCQANKVLVLDREPVAGALSAPGVTAMRADWTRPDESISRYLESFDRFGIPFNAVYGPGAPDGIVLPELLNTEAVMEALDRAGARDLAATGG